MIVIVYKLGKRNKRGNKVVVVVVFPLRNSANYKYNMSTGMGRYFDTNITVSIPKKDPMKCEKYYTMSQLFYASKIVTNVGLVL